MSSFSRKFVFAILALALIAGSIGVASAYTYNRDTAVQYALDNAYNEVPGSWYFYPRGGDCTNFASWVTYAGGWPKRYSWSGGDVWYMTGDPWPYSNSWTVVSDFNSFVKKYRGYEISLGNNKNSIESNLKYWIKKGIIQKGDLIQRVPGVKPGHTMIITEINKNDGTAKITYHSIGSDNQRNLNFVDFSKPDGDVFIALHLLDSNSY